MAQYFRITAYHPAEDLSAIFDSNGMYEKLWQFSSYIISRGFNVFEVSADDKFLDGNLDKAEVNTEQFYLRAHAKGKPESITYEITGIVYNAVKVGDKIYIPDKDKTGGAV